MLITVLNEELMEIVSSVLSTENMSLENVGEHTDLRNFYLSSITAMSLVVAVEDRYGIIVSEDDLSIENVNTIHKLKQLILKYKENGVQGAGA